MGYFANGTEGEMYSAEFCDRCIHAPNYDVLKDCPILVLHSIYNYRQHSDETVKVALDILIPRSASGLGNAQCSMFVASSPAAPIGHEQGQTEAARNTK